MPHDHNALFDDMLAAYRDADDPDRFLREFLTRLDDATSNAVLATERKLERLDAARSRLEAAREIPRPDDADFADAEDEPEPEPEGDDPEAPEDREDAEEEEAPPEPKKRKVKRRPPK